MSVSRPLEFVADRSPDGRLDTFMVATEFSVVSRSDLRGNPRVDASLGVDLLLRNTNRDPNVDREPGGRNSMAQTAAANSMTAVAEALPAANQGFGREVRAVPSAANIPTNGRHHARNAVGRAWWGS